MSKICCICGCTPAQCEKGVVFFDFPISAYLRRKWKAAIQLSGRIGLDTMVCSLHFDKSDYETVRGRARLKKSVVPSRMLDCVTEDSFQFSKKIINTVKEATISKKDDNSLAEDSPAERRLDEKDSAEDPDKGNEEKEQAILETEIDLGLISPAKNESIERQTIKNSITDTETTTYENVSRDNVLSEKDLPNPASPKHLDDIPNPCSPKNTDDMPNSSLPKNVDDMPISVSPKIVEDIPISVSPKHFEATPNLVPAKNSEDTLIPVSEKNSDDIPLSFLSKKFGTNNDKVKIEGSLEESALFNFNKEYTHSIKGLNIQNGVSKNSARETKCVPISSPTDPKQDIEDILTNYHIQNSKKGQLAIESDIVQEKELEVVKEKPPVFIEISVGRDSNSVGPNDGPGSQDCLMVLESVQVDVDPSTFLLPEQEFDIADDDDDDDDEDVVVTDNKKPDPISLLTSSDESDVILEEPNIDTVEVSDETDEDDVPLVRLVPKSEKEISAKRKSSKRDSAKANSANDGSAMAKGMWGLCEYYCIECKFYTTNRSDYIKHVGRHEKVLQICQICSFTTASKGQFERHRRKHKEERRFKCHLCEYKAKHHMSLMYHLKRHHRVDVIKKLNNQNYTCTCGFFTDVKTAMLRHVRSCKKPSNKRKKSGVKHSCKKCSYSTNRKSDLKRHRLSRHASDFEDADDEDYEPA